jgi:hypothetical protein
VVGYWYLVLGVLGCVLGGWDLEFLVFLKRIDRANLSFSWDLIFGLIKKQ